MTDNRDSEWLSTHQRVGEQLEKEGRYQDAIKVYEEIANSDPAWGNGWIFLALAELHEKIQEADLAERYFEKSVEYNNDPPNPNYRTNYAAFLLERGKSEKALDVFFEALKVAVSLGLGAAIIPITDGIKAAAARSNLSMDFVNARVQRISNQG